MSSIESINNDLSETASLLNSVANEIREIDFNKKENLQRIGTALTYIYEIQHEIYAVKPELKPDFLKE
ncbi:MAG: hypothetical protein ABFD08_05755 [Syntrophomonas sp.]